MSKRALVTGITGFVGPLLASSLLKDGYEVYGLYRKRADGRKPTRLVETGILNRVKLVEGDLTDMGSILQALKSVEPEVIFHLGAQSFVPKSFNNPIETYMINTVGTLNLLETVRILDIDPIFIFAGSSEEYGLQFLDEKHYARMLEKYKNIFPEPDRLPELPINERNPLRPMSPYATSKVHGDFLTRNYFISYGVKGIVSRAFNHEGPGRGPHFVTSTIVRQALMYKLGEVDSIRIGNVNAFRDWSHVEDIVEAYKLLGEKGRAGDVYVIGSRRTNSILTYILETFKKLKYDIKKLYTFDEKIIINDPGEECKEQFFGLDFYKTKIDCMILRGDLEFKLENKGIVLETDKNKIKIVFEADRFRPADVPVLLSDPAKIMELGFTAKRSLQDIIEDQILYFYDPHRRSSVFS